MATTSPQTTPRQRRRLTRSASMILRLSLTIRMASWAIFFFFQAEDGIRDYKVTGVQTCAPPLSRPHQQLTRADRAAEVARGTQSLHEVGGDRRPGVHVRREAREHAVVVDPVLEERRGRLHEIALGAGQPDERDLAPRKTMHEVPELVEVRHDLRVLHERGARERRRVREVAAEDTVSDLLAADTEPQRSVEEPLVLAFARMHVERDAAGGVAVDRDVKALHRRVPALLVHRRGEAHAEELAVQVQDRLAHATVLEIGTHFLRVEVEALRLHAVQVVLPLPVPDGRRAGMIDALLLEEDGELGLRGVAR